ncbi:MAG: hypothetical protein ACI9G1_000917 [Pirellulaceae bacterium]|jgi:hypothetical protein
MRVKITIASGPMKGQTLVLVNQQMLTFGRTQWADISIEPDQHMSGKHFSIANDGSQCVLEDLGSTNGTKVGDQYVKQSPLNDGDIVLAGETQFQIEITDIEKSTKKIVLPGGNMDMSPLQGEMAASNLGQPSTPENLTGSGGFNSPFDFSEAQADSPASAPSSAPSAPPVSAPPPVAPPSGNNFDSPFDGPLSPSPVQQDSVPPVSPISPIAAAPQAQPAAPKIVVDNSRNLTASSPEMLTFTSEECNTGLVNFRGPVVEDESLFKPSSLVQLFADRFESVMSVHFQKFGQETPDEFSNAIPLFDWLPPDVARTYGPVLVKEETYTAHANILDDAWDNDAAIIYLGYNEAGMLEHLQKLIHAKFPGISEEGGVTGYCWPVVLCQFLAFQDSSYSDILLGDVIAAVLMEIPDLPGTWQIFAKPEFGETLRDMGLKHIVTDESLP